MSYRPTPYGGDVDQLPRHVNEELQRIALYLERLTSVVTDLVAYRIIGGVSDRWLWDDTSTVMGDPGAGYIRGDSNNLGGTNNLAVSKTDAFGRDLDTLSPAESSLLGEFVFLELVGGNYLQGLVTADVDNTTWRQITLTAVSGSGNPGQDEVAEFIWYPSQSLIEPALAGLNMEFDWRRLARDVAGL